jgi:heme-degrading monooxygenase HmoA
VANGMDQEVRAAFVARPHLVDQAEGFLRMVVLQGDNDPSEFCLVTFWRDAACFDRWFRSDAHRASHVGIPKGLKVVPGSVEVKRLQVVTE